MFFNSCLSVFVVLCHYLYPNDFKLQGLVFANSKNNIQANNTQFTLFSCYCNIVYEWYW